MILLEAEIWNMLIKILIKSKLNTSQLIQNVGHENSLKNENEGPTNMSMKY